MNRKLVQMAFSHYHRTDYFTLEEAIQFLWDRDLINVGEMAELAIARVGKKQKATRGKKGYDFESDKSDSKYVTVSHYKQPSGNIASYASIGGLRNKIGTLRVMVFEPLTCKNYFFKIPRSVYGPYQDADDSLKIYFSNDGAPREPRRCNIRYNLWDYECNSEEWAK